MKKKIVYIVEMDTLFKLVKEIHHICNFNLNYIKKDEFLELQKKNFLVDDTIFIINDLKQRKNTSKFINCMYFKNETIKISKFLEDINLFFLKISYKNNSKISLKNYTLDANGKYLILGLKKLKLTEKEIYIILHLLSQKKPQNSSTLQKKVWCYQNNLDTHTVETHIYRLRKKIKNTFNDDSFLNTDKNGYFV